MSALELKKKLKFKQNKFHIKLLNYFTALLNLCIICFVGHLLIDTCFKKSFSLGLCNASCRLYQISAHVSGAVKQIIRVQVFSLLLALRRPSIQLSTYVYICSVRFHRSSTN